MTKTCNIFLSVDVGGSQTKIIYQFPGWDKPLCLLMSPGVEQITKSDLKRYYDQLGWIGAPSDEQQAWVEWKGNIFVVGDFTSEFAPQDRILERKYENALYKVLAAIGVILSKHDIKPKRRKNAESQSLYINLYIGLLLPWNEYNDRKRFQEQLELMLRSLKFRGQSWNVNLCAFECRPEGGGLAAIRIKQKGLDWLQKNKVAVLMFGHRNVTAIYFDSGAIKQGDSPLLGFITLLDDVCRRVSGLERDKLAASIFETIDYSKHHIYHNECTVHPKWEESKAIAALATAKDETLRASEIEDIVFSIKLAIPTYWNQIKKWLDKNIFSMPSEVIIGGGAAEFLEPELEEYFNCRGSRNDGYGYTKRKSGERTDTYYGRNSLDHADLIWVEDIQKQIENIFEFHWKVRKHQSIRLIDCFGMFDQLKDIVREAENAKN
ncbi:MAG: ParM/StbA family protein [Richelia sp. SL_2_1]|nr:ParM/StbA family protein [Richelia sp. SL_2_1]